MAYNIANASTPLIHFIVNGSRVTEADLRNLIILNGTMVEVGGRFRDSQLSELLYVVIVIMFYAMALMVLIATQIRRQRQGQEIEYYDEYLERNDRLKKKNKMLATIATVPEEIAIAIATDNKDNKTTRPTMTWICRQSSVLNML